MLFEGRHGDERGNAHKTDREEVDADNLDGGIKGLECQAICGDTDIIDRQCVEWRGPVGVCAMVARSILRRGGSRRVRLADGCTAARNGKGGRLWLLVNVQRTSATICCIT